MATTTVQVSTSIDDARSTNSTGAFNSTSTSLFLGKYSDGNDYYNGFRWTNVTVPQGATITSATIDLFSSQQTGGTTAKTIWHGEAVDNAAQFSSSHAPNSITTTTASDSYDITVSKFTALGFGVDSIVVTNSVQEIVNRAGWASGNALILVGHDNGSAASSYVGSSTYDRLSSRGAQLTINYTTGGTTTGEIKVWDGTQFTAKPVKVWDGSSWVIKPVKVWDGTSWVATNY